MEVACLLKGGSPWGKACFKEIIRARQKAGDKAREIRARLRLTTTTFCVDYRENLVALSQARQTGDRPRVVLVLVIMGYCQRDDGNTGAGRRALAIQKAIR